MTSKYFLPSCMGYLLPNALQPLLSLRESCIYIKRQQVSEMFLIYKKPVSNFFAGFSSLIIWLCHTKIIYITKQDSHGKSHCYFHGLRNICGPGYPFKCLPPKILYYQHSSVLSAPQRSFYTSNKGGVGRILASLLNEL